MLYVATCQAVSAKSKQLKLMYLGEIFTQCNDMFTVCSSQTLFYSNMFSVTIRTLTLSPTDMHKNEMCTPKLHINLAFRFLLLKGPAMAWCQAYGPFIIHKTNIPL